VLQIGYDRRNPSPIQYQAVKYPNMRRLLHMTWMLVLATMLLLFFSLQPMSGHFLDYLIWRYTTAQAMETGNIAYRGALIRYVAYGQGKPVLLLHGGLSNKLSWFSQIPMLVEAGRRVVLIDTRGHGDSTRGNFELSYQIFAEDTIQVLDRLAIKRTDIVGWSDGGIIALLLGLEAPQRVDKIVAISANFHPSGLVPESDHAEKSYPVIESIKNSLRSWWSGAGDQHSRLEAEIKALWRSAPLLAHADLRAITAPTLVIVGENDIIQLPHSSELAQMVANGSIEIISGAGHAAPVTHADQVNQLVASFLGLERSH